MKHFKNQKDLPAGVKKRSGTRYIPFGDADLIEECGDRSCMASWGINEFWFRGLRIYSYGGSDIVVT